MARPKTDPLSPREEKLFAKAKLDALNQELAMSKVQAEADAKSIDPPMRKVALKLWQLTPKDKAEPPFHFTGVMEMYVVAAATEEEARYLAAMCSEPHGSVWMDDDMTDCVALVPSEPGVIAQG